MVAGIMPSYPSGKYIVNNALFKTDGAYTVGFFMQHLFILILKFCSYNK